MLLRSLTLGALLIATPTLALAQATSGSLAQYTSQSDATAKCSGDTVVWANPTSKALHTSGTRYFGKSKHGFYACEKDAVAAGYHLAGHGHHKKHVATSS